MTDTLGRPFRLCAMNVLALPTNSVTSANRLDKAATTRAATPNRHLHARLSSGGHRSCSGRGWMLRATHLPGSQNAALLHATQHGACQLPGPRKCRATCPRATSRVRDDDFMAEHRRRVSPHGPATAASLDEDHGWSRRDERADGWTLEEPTLQTRTLDRDKRTQRASPPLQERARAQRKPPGPTTGRHSSGYVDSGAARQGSNREGAEGDVGLVLKERQKVVKAALTSAFLEARVGKVYTRELMRHLPAFVDRLVLQVLYALRCSGLAHGSGCVAALLCCGQS